MPLTLTVMVFVRSPVPIVNPLGKVQVYAVASEIPVNE